MSHNYEWELPWLPSSIWWNNESATGCTSVKLHPITHSYLKSLNLFIFFEQNKTRLTCYILPPVPVIQFWRSINMTPFNAAAISTHFSMSISLIYLYNLFRFIKITLLFLKHFKVRLLNRFLFSPFLLKSSNSHKILSIIRKSNNCQIIK